MTRLCRPISRKPHAARYDDSDPPQRP